MKFQAERPLICYFELKGGAVNNIFSIKPEDVRETSSKDRAILQAEFVECVDEYSSKYIIRKMRAIDGGMVNMSKTNTLQMTLPSPDMQYQD